MSELQQIGLDVHHRKLAIVIFLALWPIRSYAQNDAQSEEEKLFASTFWEPNKGVKLLKASSAKKTWRRYEKKCALPEFAQEHFAIQEYYVFRTEHHVIFVYNIPNQHGPYWTICDKRNKHNLFESKDFAAGYEILKDGTLKPYGQCIDASPGNVQVRFRSYEKDKLFLEMNFHICQSTRSHEFLYHLDKKGVTEVNGSRLTFYDDDPSPLIYWYYHGKDHRRMSKKSWNENDELIWSRKLEVAVRDKSEPAVWSFQCQYDKDKREVICDKELIKGSKITHWHSEYLDCGSVKGGLDLIPQIELLGITVSSKVKKQLKEEKSKWCDKGR